MVGRETGKEGGRLERIGGSKGARGEEKEVRCPSRREGGEERGGRLKRTVGSAREPERKRGRNGVLVGEREEE